MRFSDGRSHEINSPRCAALARKRAPGKYARDGLSRWARTISSNKSYLRTSARCVREPSAARKQRQIPLPRSRTKRHEALRSLHSGHAHEFARRFDPRLSLPTLSLSLSSTGKREREREMRLDSRWSSRNLDPTFDLRRGRMEISDRSNRQRRTIWSLFDAIVIPDQNFDATLTLKEANGNGRKQMEISDINKSQVRSKLTYLKSIIAYFFATYFAALAPVDSRFNMGPNFDWEVIPSPQTGVETLDLH